VCFIPSECFKATTSGFSHQQFERSCFCWRGLVQASAAGVGGAVAVVEGDPAATMI